MRTPRLVTTGFAGIALAAALVAPGAARTGAQTSGEQTKQLDAKQQTKRTGSINRPKVAGKVESSRPHPALVDSPALQKAGRTAETVEQFRGRARADGTTDFGPQKQKKASGRKALGPLTLPAGKTAARDKINGAGTGGGDLEEIEPNDSSGQDLPDLPVNVFGTISSPADIADCFAVEVTQGDPVRIEVVADRVFNSGLDSYLTVLEDDGSTVIVENDDGFEDSVDSFVRFTAPYTGTIFVCVQDSFGFGDSSFIYVVNITIAEFPDISEVEFNDDLGSADSVLVPSLVFGDMGAPGDLDVFTFTGTEGTTLVVDVDAAIFLSTLDSIVGLYDDGGGLLFAYDEDDADPTNPDTRFNIVLPYTGRYYVSVGDAFERGNGAGDYYYSLSLTAQSGALAPRVTGVKLTVADFAKKVIGSGFSKNAFAELTADNTIARRLNSFPAPNKPKTAIKLSPPIEVFTGDVFTVVNRDGRRSNPGVLN
jgi:hypothetical protein